MPDRASNQTDHVAPSNPAAPREREWRIRKLPPGVRGGPLCEGDHILKVDGVPGVSLGRNLSDAEFFAMLMELGEYLELIRDSHLPSAGHLRLLP